MRPQKLFDLEDTLHAQTTKVSASFMEIPLNNAETEIFISTKSNTAMDLIKGIQINCCRIIISNGEFSLWNLVEGILREKGSAELYFATWSISEMSARKIVDMINEGLITSCSGILDYRSKNRHEAAYHLVKSTFNKVKTESCHAKLTILRGENYNISIVGSSNVTENPRVETNVLIESEKIAIELKETIDKLLSTGYEFD